jgi:co-chaperonin GroES (HSP10)
LNSTYIQQKQNIIIMNEKPIGDRLLLKAVTDQQEKSESGILLPEQTNQKYFEVVELGTSHFEGNKKVAFPVSVGDKVVIHPQAGITIKVKNNEFKLINTSDVLVVVKG